MQQQVMDVLVDRDRRGKSLTIMGVVNETGMKTSTVDRIFRTLRVKGRLEIVVGAEHRIVQREPVGDTYRRVAEDGVEVTQCPPGYARGYWFDVEKS